MKKRAVYTLLLISSMVLFCACGDTKNDSTDKNVTVVQESNEADASTEVQDDTTNTSENTETPSEIQTYTISGEEPAGDGEFYIRPMGLQQYDSFEGETFTDTPSEGKKYLVLYLDIRNNGEESFYFNPECFTATLDGESISSTYLMNDPKDYLPAFHTIEPGEEFYGYIVWEVPEDWKELKYNYTGWKITNNAIIEGTYGMDDLSDPVEDINGYLE